MQLNYQMVPRGAIAWIIGERAEMYDHNRVWSIMESARQEMISDGHLTAPIFSSGSWRILRPETPGADRKNGL
ncbi:MAG TPA: hypothetical protein VFO74_16005 [Pseudolabrys sp.]|nr:hypothetical protein [Pseudolabrys sp.]